MRQVVVGRELTWRPQLSGTGYGWLRLEPEHRAVASGAGRDHGTHLSNAGGSPAMGARYVYRRPEAPGWFLSDPVTVPAHGAKTEVHGGRLVDEKLARMWLGSITVVETLAGAIFCRDFLLRSWCFPIPDAGDGDTLEGIVWRKGAPAPGWAVSPELWGPQAA